jgi:hypothetical protein
MSTAITGEALHDRSAERRFSVFAVGAYTGEAWREAALARAAAIWAQTERARAATGQPDAEADAVVVGIRGQLATARDAAQHGGRWWRLRAKEALQERTTASLDAAECDLLRLAPLSSIRGQMPALLGRVRASVRPDDPTREAFEKLVRDSRERELEPFERDVVVSAVQTAAAQRRHEIEQVRYLRHVLLVVLALVTVAAVTFAVIGFARPSTLPLCFPTEEGAACPTSQTVAPGSGAAAGQTAPPVLAEVDRLARRAASEWDILLVELLGVMAASLAAATTLRGFRQRRSPYDFPLLLALIKLPTGALTAVFGLLLIRAQFIPGLSALDSATQIVAWAVVLGYAQQILTRLIDQRAQAVLDAVDADPTERRSAEGRGRAEKR